MEVSPPTTASGNEDDSIKQIIRACDLCRKKKIRCELIGDGCARCFKYNEPCTFTPIRTKKGPRRPPGYKHVEALEERLKRMEEMLKSQNSIQVEDREMEKATQTGQENINRTRKASHSLQNLSAQRRDSKRVRRQSHMTSNPSISSSSESVQNTHVLMEKDFQYSVPSWKFTAASDVLADRTFRQFPPKADAELLIQEMFDSHNAAFPIFDRESFLSTFKARYPIERNDDLGWWACLNVAFTLGHRFRAMRTLNGQLEDLHAWGYLQNALAVVTELTMLKSNLFAVQAILGIAISLQGTSSSQPCSVLVSTALRLAQSMKLHQQYQGSSLSNAEIEQRKRVFWIAYIIDKDISLQTGDPPAQDDDDMDVDLPAETTEPHPKGISGVNFFNLHIGLAIIQGQIYRRLFSTKSLRLPEIDRLIAATELDTMLDGWKMSAPIGVADDDALGSLSVPTRLHTVILSFTYFHTLATIHSSLRVGSHLQAGYIDPDSVTPQSPDVRLLSEAQKSIRTLSIMPHGDFAWVWLLLDYIFLASKIILSNIISNPSHSLGNEDLKLVEPVLQLFKTLGKGETDSNIGRLQESLGKLWRRARVVIDNLDERRKNNPDGGEKVRNMDNKIKKDIRSVDDFISRIELGAECWNPEKWI